MNCKESITVNRQSIDWLKKNYPDLCIKAGLCERVAGKLYTKILSVNLAAAPEAPKCKPLTDEQIDALRSKDNGKLNFVTFRAFRIIARAVEAAHGIKENSNDRSR